MSLTAKYPLIQSLELEVKRKRCLVLGSKKDELSIRLHLVPFHVSNMALKDVLEKYGAVEEVTREI